MGISLNPSTILSGQGIDVSSLVQQIITGQSGEISVWQGEATTLASQNGVLEGIGNDLTNLQSAVQALSDPNGALASQSAISSNTNILSASAQSSAVAGTHQIVVTSLATAGTLFSNAVTSPTASFLPNGSSGGDIQLQVGGASGTTHDLPITPGSNDSLNTLASYINTQSSANDWGVTASVVNNGSGYVLALQSQSTGSAGALSIAGNSGTNLSFQTPQGGANASFTIDGALFGSASNTVTGAIQGVTLNLVSQSPATPVSLTIAPDTDQITSAVNNFVSAYNSVISDINAQYVVDPTGSTPAPPLESDSSLRSLQSSLLNDAAYALPGATGGTAVNDGLVNLASLGINMNNDGTLTVGSNVAGQSFAQIAAANPTAVTNFFQNGSGTGFANSFNSDLTSLTDPTEGPLNVDVTQNQATEQTLTTNISNLQLQLSTQQAALTSEFDSVNASLQSYPLLLQEVTETLGTLGSGTSSSGSLISSEPTLTSGL